MICRPVTEVANTPASAPPASGPSDGVSKSKGWPLIVAVLALFAGLSAWCAYSSGGFIEADGISHFLKRRFAWENPSYRIDIWARPLCVWLYMLPAHAFGLMGVRLTSLLLAVLIALMTWRCAVRLELKRAELVVPLLVFQPLFFMHSCSELTELTFALVLLGMFWAYMRKQFWLLALLASIAPLARPEGFGFLFVAFVAVLLHRRWLSMLLLPLGLAAWSYFGWRQYGSPDAYPWWKWLAVNWPFSPESAYGKGTSVFYRATTFLGNLPVIVGPVATPLVFVGAWAIVRWREAIRSWPRDHGARCAMIVPGLAWGMLAAHTLLWIALAMASAGMARYLVTVGPFFALIALAGANWLIDAFRIRWPAVWVVAGCLAVIPIHGLWRIYPIRVQGQQLLAERTAAWVHERVDRAKYPRLMTSLPGMFYTLDVDEQNAKQSVPWGIRQIESPEPGVLMVYERETGSYNASASSIVPREAIDGAGWVRIGSVYNDDARRDADGKWVSRVEAEVFLSPTDINGAATGVAPVAP